MSSSRKYRLALIGVGAMGSALAKGLSAKGTIEAGKMIGFDVDEARLRRAIEEIGIAAANSCASAVADAEIVLIAVKPKDVQAVLAAIGPIMRPNQLLISIAAGVSLDSLQGPLSPDVPVIRSMPNTPCLVGEGMTGYALGRAATAEHGAVAQEIFGAVGRAIQVPENLLDVVTGLSGSGPAFVYIAIEALADGGVKMGLPRADAQLLAAQTLLGSAKMVLETGQHPGALKDAVASPGGTTIAGLAALENAGFRSALIQAVEAATNRCVELRLASASREKEAKTGK